MPANIRAGFHDIDSTRRDLESVNIGLGRELTALLRSDVDTVARTASTLTPTGPGPRSPRDNLPHVSDTITGVVIPTGVAVVSTHPAAGVLEYGGTISPRGSQITIAQHAMAHRAGDSELPRLERELTARIDALLRTHGL